MKPESMPATQNQTAISNSAVTTARAKWFHGALAIAVLIGLAAVAPSAQGQTLTVLYSFQEGSQGYDPIAGVLRRHRVHRLLGRLDRAAPVAEQPSLQPVEIKINHRRGVEREHLAQR
jgi:hypothetical protein